jgi:hypothetical protein
MSSIAGGKRIASNMAGQPSSSLYDLYYGGYDEEEPLDGKEAQFSCCIVYVH